MQGEELLVAWLGAIDRVSRNDFVSVENYDALSARVKGDSSLWSERFFTAGANPNAQTTPVKRSFHLATVDTPDLLRHEYQFKQWNLDVIESINFTLVRVQPGIMNLRDAERLSFISLAAKEILNLQDAEHQWIFQFPAKVTDGIKFSTNLGADPLNLASWKDRADGGVHQGVLYFICYKKFFDMGDYRDIQNWFDDAFRTHWRRP